MPFPRVRLGPKVVDVRARALVMGILNRTPDSFYDRGEFWDFDRFLFRAEQQVTEGADILDVGGVKAGPGPEVTEQEELDRVVSAVGALVARFDTPVSVDSWRSRVLRESCAAGAVVGNDISGFTDPEYLPVAAEFTATVVATHIRLTPRVPDPQPVYGDLVSEVGAKLLDCAARAEAVGLERSQIVLDAGLDLGKTEPMSAVLLRETAQHAELGFPLLLSASNKRFLGELLELAIDDRRPESLAAAAYGVMAGARILRVHDVEGTVKVCRTIEALIARELEATATGAGA